MNRSLKVSLLASSLAVVILLAAGCNRSSAPGATTAATPERRTIPVVRAEAQSTPDLLPFTGRIEAAQRVQVRARVSGPITVVHFTEGAVVTAGSPLFTIDPRPYHAPRDQAAASVARAQAAAALTQQELTRAQTLRASHAIAGEELERHVAEASAATATLQAAKATLASAELDLEFTVVRAPVDGRVGRALLTVGNLAVADSTVLTTLVSTDAMRVRFAVDEPTFHRLRASTSSLVSARITVTGHTYAFTANIDYLGNVIDSATGTAEVRATVVGPADALADGMFARLEIQLPAAQASVLVPETALGAEQGSRYVLVADATGKLDQRRVTLGQRIGPQRAIVSGVAAGESVVIAGLQFLRPGMTIRPLTSPPTKPSQLAAPR
jgi:RND family efflux transporter MFP subunit